MRKDKYAKIINITVSYSLAASLMIGLVACGNSDAPASDNTSSAAEVSETSEPDTVATVIDVADVIEDEDGNILDAVSHEKLTDEEIEKKISEGVLKKDKTGKISIDQNKNSKAKASGTTENKTERKTTESGKTTEVKTEAKKTEEITERTSEGRTEKTTQQKTENITEKATEARTERKTEAPTQQRTEAPTQQRTEAPTQARTEAPTCNHEWVWHTHTETVHKSEQYLVSEPWDEPVYENHSFCNGCGTDLTATYGGALTDAGGSHLDACGTGYHSGNVQVGSIHHDAVYDTDEWDEYEEVNDYQYCSKCGARK